jgi:hypothetical protein
MRILMINAPSNNAYISMQLFLIITPTLLLCAINIVTARLLELSPVKTSIGRFSHTFIARFFTIRRVAGLRWRLACLALPFECLGPRVREAAGA